MPRPQKYLAFGTRLKTLILQKYPSICQFIRRSGLKYTTTYRYVNGEGYPNQNSMIAICEALGCSVEDLMDPIDLNVKYAPAENGKNAQGGIKKIGRPFRPGESGNPKGIKRSREEKEIMASVQRLIPGSVEKLESMLDDPETTPMTKVRICKMILNRACGKPKAASRMENHLDTLEQMLSYVRNLSSQAVPEGGKQDHD